METRPLLFSLLRSAMSGDSISEQEKESFSDRSFDALMQISKMHDIAPLLAFALDKNGMAQDRKKELSMCRMTAIYRYEQTNYELQDLCDALETAKISFLPLKGSVIRKYYPEAWMRTSCDIDILVRKEEIEQAAAYLVGHCGYTYGEKSSHDISLFSQSNSHIELHYDLVEDGIANAASELLQSVWNSSALHDGYHHWHEMTDEMFYFYHIAHMAKHFVLGGCGIRPFIDLWILEHLDDADRDKREHLLKQGELLRFAEMACQLSRVWFGDETHSDITNQMERYILRGGVYGTSENRIAVQQQKKGGRFRYAMSRIFLPYDQIKYLFPVLQKHRWLTPMMEVCRWFKLLFGGRAKSSLQELKYNQHISQAEAETTRVFLNAIGL